MLHARNPARDLHVGDNVVNFGPVNGAPNIPDLEGGRRYGDIEAFRNILKLTHALGVLHWQGGIVVEPVDVPVAVRHLATYQAHIECCGHRVGGARYRRHPGRGCDRHVGHRARLHARGSSPSGRR